MHKEKKKKLVFVIGCSRSGTTWVQIMLCQHPKVVTSQETHLFSNYVRHMYQQWQAENSATGELRSVGLPTLLDEKEFLDGLKAFTDTVLKKIESLNPDCEIILEKTPQHVFDVELIRLLYPESYFVHVVRDPRAVCASLKSAASSWGKSWAPQSVIEGAGLWRAAIVSARKLNRENSHYFEVRYEDMRLDCKRSLSQIFERLGLHLSMSRIQEICEMCRFDNMKVLSRDVSLPWNPKSEPQEFYRRGQVRAWESELSDRDVRSIEFLCSDLMAEFGYPISRQLPKTKPLDIWLYESTKRILSVLNNWPVTRRIKQLIRSSL